jgi:hypothetical protein
MIARAGSASLGTFQCSACNHEFPSTACYYGKFHQHTEAAQQHYLLQNRYMPRLGYLPEISKTPLIAELG